MLRVGEGLRCHPICSDRANHLSTAYPLKSDNPRHFAAVQHDENCQRCLETLPP